MLARGEIGDPCGVPFRSLRARFVRRLPPSPSSSSSLGQVSPAYSAVDWHAVRRLRRWLCLKHKVKTGKYVRFPDTRLRDDYGLTGRKAWVFSAVAKAAKGTTRVASSMKAMR